jgi:hypothetical protein
MTSTRCTGQRVDRCGFLKAARRISSRAGLGAAGCALTDEVALSGKERRLGIVTWQPSGR